MAVAIGIWSLELTPGKIDIVEPEADLRITNVSFGDVLKDASGRTTVKFTYQVPANIHSDDDEDDEDQEVSQASKTAVLCSLKPGTFEQASTNIVLQEYEQYTFEVIGKNVVYLTGNYLDQAVNNPPFMDSGDEMESDDEEDAHDLRDISSDVEMHPDDLLSDASGLEELEEAPKLLKRPREQDTEPDAAKLSKSEKKKKQKGDNGKAIAKSVDEKKPEEKKDKETKNDKQESDSIPSKKANEIKKSKPVEREITGGVKVLDAKIGTGRMAKKGNTVGMRYIGKLQNGKVFDKNISGKPFTFHLGKGEVIKGWDEGIVGMQVGGERRLVISPEMAYGKKGMGDIPKHSTLIFEVKLVEIK